MRLPFLCCLLGAVLAGPALAACDETTWRFGMSPDEVQAVTACGPYASFSNGDLETYQGVFEGHEENFQFFFVDGKLQRVGIYLYEGTDRAAAAKEWAALHDVLARRYGEVETPGYAPEGGYDAAAFAAQAEAAARRPGKSQMAPASQPADRLVFASLLTHPVEDEDYYYVVVYFDPHD